MTREQVAALWSKVTVMTDSQRAAILCLVWGYLQSKPDNAFFEKMDYFIEQASEF